MQQHDLILMNLTMSLGQAARAYKSVADKLAAGFGLSQATAWPLVIVGRLGDGVRPGMVADALGLEPSSLVRVIDHLIDAGLLERHDDAGDRRAKTLHLTAAGTKTATRIEEALVPFRRKLFSNIDTADVKACIRVFEQLNTAIAGIDEEQFSR